MCQRSLMVLALGTLLVACSHKPNPVYTTSGVEVGGTLLVEMWASDDCVQTGDTVHLRATVTNKGAKTQVIELTDRPVLDIDIGSRNQRIRWSDGRHMTSDLTRLQLKPGEAKTIEMDWQPPKYGGSGPFGVGAIFTYDLRFPSLTPSVLVEVGQCVGWLGP